MAARIDPEQLRDLEVAIGAGDAVLFTGAGFSVDARDAKGRSLPDSERMRHELWKLVFPAAELDDSTLQDLYDVALAHAAVPLAEYLATRLRIASIPNVERYAAWFSLPWRRVYTLNVDDLEAVLLRETSLARRLVSVSALRPRPDVRDALEVIHLNGIAVDGVDGLTFSTLQYAARLCGGDREYQSLVRDFEQSPFVFVGTTLDEVVLWQHLELRRRAGARASPHPSYLIARTLSRARQMLLQDLGIRWLEATLQDVMNQMSTLPIATRRSA